MMNIWYDPSGIDNFHNQPAVLLRISGEQLSPKHYAISDRQAHRLRKHFCGMADCQCLKGGVRVHALGGSWVIKTEFCLGGAAYRRGHGRA